ncbi:stage II sporulation protein D [Domibacillus epiphyticus]|uniref:Stage II sporulation protein D n=1 Tax=Domibacillus epiphyticus TaxID=1714355 RepID=A0A1V2A6I4_9BACI|nr:stage II sporulation protein D [Domibacillus epiphyticus]OMP66599.1 stage II sporulation protein D [Domibacillus epiphyticus]
MKKPFYLLLFILIAAIAIPAVGLILTEKEEEEVIPKKEEPSVDIVRSDSQKTESVPLEEYVTGVVAAEMPASFEKEALKAQAVAARTFILTQTLAGMEVTDTVDDQVFKDKEELKQTWGDAYEKNKEKIEDAAKETEGEVLVYNGEPITAAFFSSGNGKTENAEDYWQSPLPYLISVDSPWDESAPNFEQEMVIPRAQVEETLDVTLPDSGEAGTVKERTSGGRVAEIVIDGKTFTGREIREKLGLPSADFHLKSAGGEVIITTKGYGHGVGMSQYGANGMAKEGKKYTEITEHYYPGASIESAGAFLK